MKRAIKIKEVITNRDKEKSKIPDDFHQAAFLMITDPENKDVSETEMLAQVMYNAIMLPKWVNYIFAIVGMIIGSLITLFFTN